MGFAESYSKTQHKLWHPESMKVMNKFIEMCSFISICTYILVFFTDCVSNGMIICAENGTSRPVSIPAETVAFI